MPKRKRRSRPDGNQFGLLQIGALLMIVGPCSYLLMQQFMPLGPLVTANLQGQAAGRAVASILFFVVGAGLVIAHFVRRR